MSRINFQRQDGLGVISIASPPVNAISASVIAGLEAAIAAFAADRSLAALVIYCEGATFVAGGDIGAFDAPGFTAAPYNALLAGIEALDRPVVAALHGSVLGGGLELALACHYRIAQSGSRLGFPEVTLGLIPGSLGTQRLTRLVGPRLALDLMLSARMMGHAEALQAGLLDAVYTGSAREAGIGFAQQLRAVDLNTRRVSLRQLAADEHAQALAEAASVASRKWRYPAYQAVLDAVQAAGDFSAGERVEARAFAELVQSPVSRALRHLFFAQRQAAKLPQASPVADTQIQSVGILGAGTMGSGIAMCFLNAGIATVLVDSNAAGLDRGAQLIASTYAAQVEKKRLSADQAHQRQSLLTTSLDDQALADCDLVIEAVYENLELKLQVCQRLGEICKPGAIIATNTSTLDVDLLAAATGRPADVLGMHFFSPAQVMRLLEVVRGKQTSAQVLGAVLGLARRIAKTAVVSGVCYGFIGNRMAEVYMREAEFLLLEGATPAQIDGAVEQLGMAMGPCRMLDMAGIDVGAKTVIEYEKTGGLPPDSSYRAVVRKMFALGRFGQKTGSGYYRYQGREAIEDPQTLQIAAALAREHGIAPRTDISDQEIVERLLYVMVNEGFKILEEGIAYRAGDIDVVWTCGYGFPDFLGGPMWMAKQIGLEQVVERLNFYAATRGNPFGYWSLAPLLQQLASQRQDRVLESI